MMMAKVAEAVAAQQDEEVDLEHESANNRSKPRWRMSPECKLALERAYLVDKCPSLATREALAAEYDVTARQVQVWFQNKRQRSSKRMSSDNIDSSPQQIKRPNMATGPLGGNSLSVGPTPMQREMHQHRADFNARAALGGQQPVGGGALPLQIASVPAHCSLSQLIQPPFRTMETAPGTVTNEASLAPNPSLAPSSAMPRRVGSVDSLADLAFVASRVEEMSESLSRVGSVADLSSLSRVGSLADLASFSRAGSLVDLASFNNR